CVQAAPVSLLSTFCIRAMIFPSSPSSAGDGVGCTAGGAGGAGGTATLGTPKWPNSVGVVGATGARLTSLAPEGLNLLFAGCGGGISLKTPPAGRNIVSLGRSLDCAALSMLAPTGPIHGSVARQ